MEVKAPGVVKFLGEHAVVYGHLGIAAAIGRYTKASIVNTDSDTLEVELKDLNKKFSFTANELSRIYGLYKEHPLRTPDNIKSFSAGAGLDPDALPYTAIAARLAHQYSVPVLRKRISITSDIPMGKGYASSAACSTAFMAALIGKGSSLTDPERIDVARDGERIMHANPGAGTFDVSTSYYGGIVSFRKGREPEAHREDVSLMPGIVVIDTGPKKSTKETVGHIREQWESKRDFVEKRLNEINLCSEKGLAALKEGKFDELGSWMNKDHALLAELGVSSKSLDTAIRHALNAGAWGAKLSGGGGGGIALAVAKDPQGLASSLNGSGYSADVTEINNDGAHNYI